MYDNSAQTQKPRKLIILEEFFPRKFFQNNSVEAVHTVSRCEIQDKKEDVDHGGPSETLSSDFVLFGGTPISSRWSWTLAILHSPKEVLTQALEKPEMYTSSTNTL